MKIASTQLQMTSQQVSMQRYEQHTALRMWADQAATQPSTKQQPAPDHSADRVSLSPSAQAAAKSTPQQASDSTSLTPQLQLLRDLIESLTGKKIQVFSLQTDGSTTAPSPTENAPATANADSRQPTSAGYGVSYDAQESYTESQQTDFSASGSVTTSDGQNIAFSLHVSMAYSYTETSETHLRLGDAARKTDPLILNFNGQASQLQDTRFNFDLNADGKAEQINLPGTASGFLVFDRNGDGRINDGRELFGPSSGDGFSELKKLDSDGNGWLDENDPAYQQLQIWQPDAQGGGSLTSLKTADVGAISLQNIATPFTLRDDAQRSQGEIAKSGIFLRDSGGAGTIQHVDLTI